MTSLLPASTTSARSAADIRADLGHRRPLVVMAALGGVAAAGATLLVCLAVGVVGWYAADAGAHGSGGDALRVGAWGWLMGHGSGIRVQGVLVTAVPWGITLICAWAVWRVGLRVGDSVSGHGPDADRIADGERDWTVPMATLLFTSGYLATAAITCALAGTAEADLSSGRVAAWAVLMCVAVGGIAIAIGSGRAAIWTALVPESARSTVTCLWSVLRAWLVVAVLALVAALVADFGTAANVMSQLHTGPGDATVYTLATATVLPNATVFSGSFLLGPGFSVGLGTLVSPSAVVLGPLPMFPLLAALPDAGTPAGWVSVLPFLAPLVALAATVRAQRHHPTLRWDHGAARGLAGGVLAGIAFGLLAALAGGAVGPGRMSEGGPLAASVTLHAITSFGIGGLLGGLLMTWWQRRHAIDIELDEDLGLDLG